MLRPTPNWQPLSMLPTLADTTSAQLDEVKTQLQSLREAQKQPHVLDDYTVGRVLKVYGEQQEFMWVYEAQIDRWQKESLSQTQRQQLDQLSEQIKQIKPVVYESLINIRPLANNRSMEIQSLELRAHVNQLAQFLLGGVEWQ